MTTITLQGSCFYLAGSFSMGTRENVLRKLTSRGATISDKLIAQKVDCFIAGRRCTNKYNQARSRNIPIIDEDQLLTLLQTGQVDTADEAIFDVAFDINVAIEQLRGLFDGAPTSATWTAILEIIEQCDPQQMDTLLGYISNGVARWQPTHTNQKWEVASDHKLLEGVRGDSWKLGLRVKELCVAPPVWIMEMLRDEPMPKHQLTRLLNFHFFTANGGQITHVLNNPYLDQVNTIIIGYRNTVSKSMFRTMVTSPVMRTVKTLYLHMEYAKYAQYLVDMLNEHQDEHTMGGLEHLYTGWARDFKDVQALQNARIHNHYYY